jgi:large subunit ribosomal protein L19
MIHPKLDSLHLSQVNRELNFKVGDTVRVHYRIKEGNKERIQLYEGVVISIQNKASNKSFTVRRISYDVGVERVFPLYTPTIEKIERVRSSKVKRAKLYFLREKVGKQGRLKEIKADTRRDNIYEKAQEHKAKAPVEETVEQAAEEQAATES